MEAPSVPPLPLKWPLLPCLFILVTELCERFAYYGFTGSLVFFFTRAGMPSVLATELNSLFSSLVYITPVLGAYVADVYWGRYKTTVIFCVWCAPLLIPLTHALPRLQSHPYTQQVHPRPRAHHGWCLADDSIE